MKLETAWKYLESFFKFDFDTMGTYLHDDLEFHGLLLVVNSKGDYLETLIADKNEKAHYEVLYEFENEKSVCIIYEITKLSGESFPIIQVFDFRGQKISKILTIFDTKMLVNNSQ